MKRTATPVTVGDPWTGLKRFTNARIALGRTGMSQPTGAHLAFQLAHAKARDAVNLPLDFDRLEQDLARGGISVVRLGSAAGNRPVYLQRPDLGRRLDTASEEKLGNLAENLPTPDIALVICDGLSSPAVANHAAPFANILVKSLAARGYGVSPACLVAQGRVAVGDPIGTILSATMTVVLVGERPGLSSPNSMGVYFTYGPKPGLTDADRNCISNIHRNGLCLEAALEKLLYLIAEADRRKLSGIHLKDDAPGRPALLPEGRKRNFLLA